MHILMNLMQTPEHAVASNTTPERDFKSHSNDLRNICQLFLVIKSIKEVDC